MLNITHNQVNKKVSLDSFESGKRVSGKIYYKYINRFLLAFAIILLIVLFLPWTQTISGQGQVLLLFHIIIHFPLKVRFYYLSFFNFVL